MAYPIILLGRWGNRDSETVQGSMKSHSGREDVCWALGSMCFLPCRMKLMSISLLFGDWDHEATVATALRGETPRCPGETPEQVTPELSCLSLSEGFLQRLKVCRHSRSPLPHPQWQSGPVSFCHEQFHSRTHVLSQSLPRATGTFCGCAQEGHGTLAEKRRPFQLS